MQLSMDFCIEKLLHLYRGCKDMEQLESGAEAASAFERNVPHI